ncbi:MAG: hypothetical protein AAGB46_08040 [Verrucomicrobiota bacterium]
MVGSLPRSATEGWASKGGGSFKGVVFVAAFICALLVLGWMFSLPYLAKVGFEKKTGFELSARSLGGNPFGVTLNARDVGVGNPEGFGVGALMELDALALDVEPRSVESDTLVFRLLDMDIRRLSLVIAESGESNLALFSGKLDSLERGVAFNEASLSVGELEIVDYSKAIPFKRSVTLDREWLLEDVKSYAGLFSPVMALAKTMNAGL